MSDQPELTKPRKLRRMATFYRDQTQFGPVLDVQDELRAMGAMAKTLECLPQEAQFRVMRWLNARLADTAMPITAVPEPEPPTEAESVRIARDRVLGAETA